METRQSVLAKLGPGQDALATDTPATLACSEVQTEGYGEEEASSREAKLTGSDRV